MQQGMLSHILVPVYTYWHLLSLLLPKGLVSQDCSLQRVYII